MNGVPDFSFWLRTLGLPALQVGLLVAVAGLLVPRLRSARAQRAAWLAGFGAVALVITGSLAGLDRALAGWLQPPSHRQPVVRVQTNLPVTGLPGNAFTDTELLASRSPAPTLPVPVAPATMVGARGWPAWLWLAGLGVVAGHRVWWQGMFAWWWRRRRTEATAATREEVRRVAHRLGMRPAVRVIEIPGLFSPIAFGAVRPTIGLPDGFGESHDLAEREAMLAHELAHLAARDPFWLAVADGICAVLWWVPPVWWARRQLRAACEAAADEACLVVENGPSVLADCLVALAAQLPRRRAFGLLGMAGFRSELGRRVERLLSLRGRGAWRRSGWQAVFTAAVAALGAGFLGLASSAWAFPRQGAGQPTLLALAQDAFNSVALRSAPGSIGLGETTPAGTGALPGAGSDRTAHTEPGGESAGSPNPAPTPVAPAAAAPASPSEGAKDWMTLNVHFEDPLATNRIRASMDALTRRLYATGQFHKVTCEPSDAGIKVQLQFKEGSPMIAARDAFADRRPWIEFMGGLRALVEHRGQLALYRVHADSDALVQADQCPEGYRVLAEPPAQDRPPQRFVVEQDPAPGLTEAQIQTARPIQDPVNQDWRVSLEFTGSGASHFAELTRNSVGRRIAVVVDGQVLMAPVVRNAILGGRCEISGKSSEMEASRLAALLQHPLPSALKLGGVVLPVSTIASPDAPSGPVYSVNAVGYVNFNPPSTNPTPSALPPAQPPAMNPASPIFGTAPGGTNQAAVATLVQDARLLYELGNLDAAKAKLEAVLRQQPDHAVARHYLDLVREAAQRRLAPERSGGVQAAPGSVDSAAAASALFTRTFRVNPDQLAQGLREAAEASVTNLPPVEALRRVFASFGVNFAPLPGTATRASTASAALAQEPAGRAMFYNDRTGMLLVRASLAELDTVESVLQALNEAPPQVVLDVKFVEITQEDSKALGFDWFLGNIQMGSATNTAVPPASGSVPEGVFPAGGPTAASVTNSPLPGQPATITGLLSDPQFRSVINALETAGTNARVARELRGDQLDWPGRAATNAENIRVTAATGARITGILTDPQYRVALRALEQRAGVDILAAPRVTTLSGRQAQIQIADLQTIMTGINPAALVQPGTAPGTNTIPYLTSTIPIGPTLDVIPNVSADNQTISLVVVPTVTEFLGYDQPGEGGKVRVWQDGTEKSVAQPLPRFRVRQMATQAQVPNGHTLVLGGLPVEETRLTKDKVPVLGDLPAVGNLFRNESKQAVKKNLLVFITATIVDPAGNPIKK